MSSSNIETYQFPKNTRSAGLDLATEIEEWILTNRRVIGTYARRHTRVLVCNIANLRIYDNVRPGAKHELGKTV